MKTISKFPKYSILIILLFLIVIEGCISTSKTATVNNFSSEIVTSWNELVYEIAIEEDRLLTLKGLRTASMMHAAMHDVLNSVEYKYSKYLFRKNTPNANPISGVAQAAYEVVVSQYPNKKESLKKELNTWLFTVANGASKNEGIFLGKEAALSILTQRIDDKWNGESDYTWHPMSPGVYAEFNEHSGTPEGFVFGAGWAKAAPFLLKNPSQFRSPAPPSINSEEYTLAFNEVKEYGRFNSNSRTNDQAHLAMWWKDFVENSHNRLARSLVVKENLDLWEATRAFTLLNMAIYDAYINVFDNKFFYNHWRPYTAIRWAHNDGNPNTSKDENWNNLHNHTYAFPSYPSAHGTASTAAMKVLATTLGKGDNYYFTMLTEKVGKSGPFSDKIEMSPKTRSFNSFSEAGLEASMSRVYLGIHFRYDSEEGYNLGNKVGSYVVQNYLLSKK